MADYTLSVNIIGAKELTEALTKAGGVVEQVIKDALNKTAYQLQSRAVENAPHKTGALRDSIHTEPAQATASNIEAKVGTNLEYARAQEKGTVGMVISVPNGREIRKGSGIRTRPYTFRGAIKPKYYMRKAKESTGNDYVNNMREALGIIVSHMKK